jgi:DNA-binding beta-propeller fold protein YncE
LTVNDNGRVFVIDDGNANIKKYTAEGVWQATWGSNGTGSGEYDNPAYLTVFDRHLYVADSFNQRIVITDLDGAVEDIWTDVGAGDPDTLYGIAIAEGATVAGVDVVYVAEAGSDTVLALDGDTGDLLFSFGGPGTGDGLFGTPSGIAVYVE